jgi:phage pi2 protein 07
MGISNASENGGYVYLYDIRGNQLCMIPVGTGYGNKLLGFTGNTVSIERGGYVYIFDERGNQISMRPV